MAEPFDDLKSQLSKSSLAHTGEGIVVDIGTGDGLFVYQSALRNPNKFFIGIDANPRPLEKVSEKIYRKPAKGGLSNVLFIKAAIEDLPAELESVADELHIHFPWGSLLAVVATGDAVGLKNLRRICAPQAEMEIVIAVDKKRDRTEIARLGLPDLSVDHVDIELKPRYRSAGFDILERGVFAPTEWPKMHSSWAKRLRGNEQRPLLYIIAQALGFGSNA